ncbi:MAG: rhombotarget lipoprotein [Pseudomonadales bacterium]|jgi:rhombotail lipoprotein|nr:rhombotarget lipoprotein [Pseudomonadales bacterium]
MTHRFGPLNTLLLRALLCSCALMLTGCAAWFAAQQQQSHRNASVVDFLYPNAQEAPNMQETVTTLRPPVRVGIAFVPGGQWTEAGISAEEQTRLLDQVRAEFTQYPYIGTIEVIPSDYLREGGGFDNLDQVARLFNVEVMALLSYDQVQFDDVNELSVLYWTIVGAYVIPGDRYDVQTLVDAAVFDVASRKLLFRAPGSSQVKGIASAVRFSDESREAQLNGYRDAVAQLIPNLQASLSTFEERTKQADSGIVVENRPGYRGGADLGLFALLLLAFAALVHARRKFA